MQWQISLNSHATMPYVLTVFCSLLSISCGSAVFDQPLLLCHTARPTYDKEVLAPSIGHCWGPKAYQQRGHKADWRNMHAGMQWNRSRQTERGKQKESRDCGTAPYPLDWVCSPTGPPLCRTGMQRADNHYGGWIDVRKQTKLEKQCATATINVEKKSKSVFFVYDAFDGETLFPAN